MRPSSKSAPATIDDWSDAHDENRRRVELLEGELVVLAPPSMPHQIATMNLIFAIRDYVMAQGIGGQVFGSSTGMRLAADTMLEPDVLFVPMQECSRILDHWIEGPLPFVAEILSPSNRAHDTVKKRSLCEKYGVRELWIVDPETRSVTVCVLEDGRYRDTVARGNDVVRSERGLPGFEAPIARLFES